MVMSDVIKIAELDWQNGFLFIAAVLILAVLVITKWDFIIQRFGIVTRKQLKEEEQGQTIKQLKSHAENTDLKIDQLMRSVSDLTQCVSTMSDKMTVMQEKNNSAERGRLKDRIGQAYRYYQARGSWNLMEKDAFEELVKCYEEAGGENSFVHTVCIPNSLKWEIIE